MYRLPGIEGLIIRYGEGVYRLPGIAGLIIRYGEVCIGYLALRG